MLTANEIFEKIFASLSERLEVAFEGTTIDTPPRTCSNREWVVSDFLKKSVLPISVETRQGAVIVDALNQRSNDVDIVLLNPWASPVWPYLHGIVPVEGVLCAVFVESRFQNSLTTVCKQISSVKQLIKTVKFPTNYFFNVRRTYRAESAIWLWNSIDLEPKNILISLYKNANNFSKALNESNSAIKKFNWTEKQSEECKDLDFIRYQNAVASMLPNWIYVHSKNHKNRMLFVKLQGRFEWKKEDNQWILPSNLNKIAQSSLVCPEPTKWYTFKHGSKQKDPIIEANNNDVESKIPWTKEHCWAYAYYDKTINDPLRILSAHLAFSHSVYGTERTDYSAYIRSGNNHCSEDA